MALLDEMCYEVHTSALNSIWEFHTHATPCPPLKSIISASSPWLPLVAVGVGIKAAADDDANAVDDEGA